MTLHCYCSDLFLLSFIHNCHKIRLGYKISRQGINHKSRSHGITYYQLFTSRLNHPYTFATVTKLLPALFVRDGKLFYPGRRSGSPNHSHISGHIPSKFILTLNFISLKNKKSNWSVLNYKCTAINIAYKFSRICIMWFRI